MTRVWNAICDKIGAKLLSFQNLESTIKQLHRKKAVSAFTAFFFLLLVASQLASALMKKVICYQI